MRGLAALLVLAATLGLPSTARAAAGCAGASAHDFDGDGRDDFAVGAPGSTVADRVAAGRVEIGYGRGTPGEPERASATAPDPEDGAGFGTALTTAHIDGDRCLDLLVGAPWKDVGGRPDAGAVYVVFGSPDGLAKGRTTRLLTADQWSSGQAGQLFGRSLSAADARGGDGAGVAIGAPYEDRTGATDAGAVHIAWFDRDGAPATRRTYGQDRAGQDDRVPGVAEDGDLFGWAVQLGSVGGDSARADLIVSEPHEDVDGEGTDAGSVSVVYDVSGAQPTPPWEHWHYQNLGLRSGDGGRIGFSLAYVEDAGTHYVAAGIPGQVVGGREGAGAVQLFRSTGSGLKPLRAIDRGSAARAGDRFGWSLALAGAQLTGSGPRLAVGAPYAGQARSGTVALVPLDRGAPTALVPGTAGVPGRPDGGDRFGWSVGFAGVRGGAGVLLAGVPTDRESVEGGLVVHPLGGGATRLLRCSNRDAAGYGEAVA